MKRLLQIKTLVIAILFASSATQVMANDVLIDFKFNSATLPVGVTSNGTVSTSGTVGSCTVCSQGRLQLASNTGFMQVDVASVSVFKITAKSSGASARTFTIKYKLGAASEYTTVGTVSVPQAGSEFDLAATFPQLVSMVPISILIENTPSGGEAHIHDLYVEANSGTPLSSEKEITAFKLTNNQIGEAVIHSETGTVTVSVPDTENLTSVVPEIFTISENASVVPATNTPQDFSDPENPVVYTVTAEDDSEKQWTIIVNPVNTNEELTVYEAEEAHFTGSLSMEHAGFTGSGYIDFLSSGDNSITFTVCQLDAGVRTAKFRYALGGDTGRNAGLYVNDVFISTVEFLPTASYTDWAESTVALSLAAGVSSITLTWEDDGPNLDKLSLGGTKCDSYALTVTTTNGGVVSLTPERPGNLYFDGESVTLLAENKPDLVFTAWSGDLTGTENPVQVVMNSAQNITASFTEVTAYTLDVTIVGTGSVTLSPPGGVYAEGTTVTLTASAVLGTSFEGWSGDLTGSASPATITMTSDKSVTATFAGTGINVDFETPVGFASVVTGSGPYNYTSATFYGPTIGGQDAPDTLWINGPEEFDVLAKAMYNRRRAYNNASQSWGGTMQKAPLVMVLKEGVYGAGTTESSSWNSGQKMMRLQDQGDLTIIGQGNVVLNWGFHLIDSWNILIRNISFQDYYDDGVTVDGSHHVWIDHCTFGHPTTRPANQDHPDGGVDVKAGANYVTISWSWFRNSWKTNLIGHSDSNGGEDSGKLKTTLFANYFSNSNSRNPRVRFGEVHVLNNLMEGLSLYGIAASNLSQVHAENNFYLNTRWPMYADRTTTDFRAVYGNNTDNVFTSKTGNREASGLKAVGNEYDDSGLPVITAQINPDMLNPSGRSVKFDQLNPESVFNPASYYAYTAYPASVVRTIIPIYAGAQKVNFFQDESGGEGAVVVNGTLNPFEQTLGSASAVQTYTVSATDILGNLTITPPAGFEVSANNGAIWFTSTNPLTIASVDGAVGQTTISIRLHAQSAGTYEGNIAHTASGAAAVLLAVSGTAQNAPGTVPEGTWTIYEADQLPNAFTPAFVTSNQSGTFSNTILPDPDKEGNNLLQMTTAASSNNQWRQNIQSGLQTLTLVIKAKSIDAAKNLAFDIDLDLASFRWSMQLRNDGTYSIAQGGTGTGSLDVATTEWNIYRFTKSGGDVAVYINESETPLYTANSTQATSNNYFRFGDGWGSGSIDTYIDWVLWDVTGAYSPAETSLPAYLVGGTTQEPRVTVVGSLENFSQTIGSPSDVQTYTVSGSNLANDITITPPTGYEISADNGENWFVNDTPLTLSHVDGTVASTTISVRLNASAEGDYSGNITHASADVEAVNLAVAGTAEFPPAEPTITITGTLDNFGQVVGTPSSSKTYTVSGLSLTDNITITSPEPFEISIDGSVWVDHTSSIVLEQTESIVENTTIFVRLNADAADTYTGDIVHTSPGAVSQNLSVSGTTIEQPNTGSWTVYQANELPDEFVLSPFVVSGATAGQSTEGVNAILADTEIQGNNLLKMLVPAGNEALTSFQWRQNIETDEMTVVFRVKGEPGRAIALDVDMDFSGTRSRITLRSDDNRAQVRNGSGGTGTVTLSDVTMTGWNTFRFTKTDTETRLYVNESSTPVLTSVPAAAGINNYFRFGDGDNGITMGGYIDWVAWDITGAYSPDEKALPELSGGVGEPNPIVSATGTLSDFTQTLGSPSAVQTYTVSGANLTGNITVTPPPSYELSVDGTNWFSHTTPLVLTQTDGAVASTSVSVRLNASIAGDYSGNIVHTSEGASAVNKAVNGSAVAEQTDPEVIVTGTLNPFSQQVGEPSATQSYTVSGTALTGNITITPPVNFEVSSDNGASWQTNAAPLTLAQADGNVATTTILVRLNATAAGTYNGNILHATAGATAVNLNVSGEATVVTSIGEPVNLTFSFWPNPVADRLTIQRDDWSVEGTINLYAPTGVRVLTQRVDAGKEQITVELDELPQGLFFIEYATPRGKRTLRLAKH